MASTTNTQAPVAPRRGVIETLNHYIDPQILGLLVALLLLIIVVGAQKPDIFFTPRNGLNIALAVSMIGLVSIAQTVVMLSGGLDISVGSMVGLTSVCVAMAVRDLGGAGAGIIAGLVIGGVLGFINGLLITVGKLNPVIATLGTLSVYKGVAYVITNGTPVGVIDQTFNSIGREQVLGIPLPVIILIVVAIIVIVLLRNTDIGRNIYAMGGNPTAARLSGINLNRYKLGIYTLSGLICGVTAVILTARTNSGQPASGSEGLEFAAITAAVLGGTALSGGKGTIIGTLLAVIIIGTLNNGMILLAVPTFWQEVARGMLLIVATLIQVLRTRERAG